MGEQERLLGEQSDAAAVRRDVHAGGDVGQRRPADPHMAGVRTQQPGEHVEQGRLARPVRAQHPENLARGDVQGDVQREIGAGDREGDVDAGRLRRLRPGAGHGRRLCPTTHDSPSAVRGRATAMTTTATTTSSNDNAMAPSTSDSRSR